MPRRPRNPDVIALLEHWLALAEAGDLQGVLAVGLLRDGEYTEDWVVDDLADMVLEVRGTVIRATCDIERPDTMN